MKTRIQMVGGEYGSTKDALWRGDLPLIQSQIRVVLVQDDDDETAHVYKVSQVALEVLVGTGDYEQVVYVLPVDRKSEPQPLMG